MKNTNELTNTKDNSISENEKPKSCSYLMSITDFESKTILNNIYHLIDLINYLQKDFLHRQMTCYEIDRSLIWEGITIPTDIDRYLELINDLQRDLKKMFFLSLSVRDCYFISYDMFERASSKDSA